MNKSFVGKAWLTFALYYFGVGILGLIFNIAEKLLCFDQSIPYIDDLDCDSFGFISDY